MRNALSRARALSTSIVIGILTCSCTGWIGENTEVSPIVEPVELRSQQIRRLTASQYAATVMAAFGASFADATYPTFNDDIPTIGLNNDPNLLRVSEINVDSLYAASEALALRAVSDLPDIEACVSASTDDCLSDIVGRYGRLLWRRPIADHERYALLSSQQELSGIATRAERVALLLQLLLSSPNMMFRTELGVVRDDALTLTGHEIASALSYTFWGAPPDETLRSLAENGALYDETIRVAEAERLASDPRYLDTLTEFYVDFLKLDALAQMEKNEALGLTTDARTALIAAARADIRASFAGVNSTLSSPLTRRSFTVTPDTAAFFAVSETATTYIDTTRREGLLTHPAFLAAHSGAVDSGIVKRGVFVLMQLLCMELGPPPDNITPATDLPAGWDPERATSREVLHVQHSSQPTCNGCHQFIDPAGGGFENFDAAGRYRSVEKQSVPIDASGVLTLDDETLTFADSVGYARALASSETMRACVSHQFLRFVLGAPADEIEQAAFASQLEAARADILSLPALIVTTPSFINRRTPEEK